MRALSTFPVVCPVCDEAFAFTLEMGPPIFDPDPEPQFRVALVGVRVKAPAGWTAHVDQHIAGVLG